jgi:calcineurin-like phosphoesterase family protein
MGRVLYTSDLHLMDAKVSSIRGYSSMEEHDERMLSVWREQVTGDDIVYVLGDVTSGRSRERERWALESLRALPGRKRLVAGNHDTVHPMNSSSHDEFWVREWLGAFESVQTLAVRKTNGLRLMLSHFPYDDDEGDHTEHNRHREWRPVDTGLWLLHGHTHRAGQRVHGQQVHVGFEAWGRMVHEQEIVACIKEGVPAVS